MERIALQHVKLHSHVSCSVTGSPVISQFFYHLSFTEVRCAESSKIRGKYQDRIPVSASCSIAGL